MIRVTAIAKCYDLPFVKCAMRAYNSRNRAILHNYHAGGFWLAFQLRIYGKRITAITLYPLMKWPIDPCYLRSSYILWQTIFLKYPSLYSPLDFLLFIRNHNSMPWHKSCFNAPIRFIVCFPDLYKSDCVYILFY